ncbi:Mu-like prophage major head subunit gpT family protein, partial [Ferrovibrio sp.]|uniref:Mu-like prophage major head subunit gpT family protein n=1 Tax=Ferrovibrio sp. TaxID=1917215 RepID=UPI0035B361AC
ATPVPSTGSEEDYKWLGKTTRFREWLGSRVIQNLAASSYVIKNKTFENTVGVSREDIEDDKLGVYSPLFQQLGYDAKTHPDELVFGLLKNGFSQAGYDGQYFFDTDHPVTDANGVVQSVSNSGGGAGTPWFLLDTSKPIKPIIFQKRRNYTFTPKANLDNDNVFHQNEFLYGVDARVNVGYGLWQLAYGSKQTLDAANYNTAFASLQGMKGDNGKPLGVRPTLLVVPPSLRDKALEVVKAERLANGATNVNRDTADVLVTPWLG